MVEVKVLGLPRSGTHYLRWIIERNFDARDNKAKGWEHALPDDRWINVREQGTQRVVEMTEGLRRIVIFKDRTHWLASVERRGDTQRMISEHFGPYVPLYDRFHRAWAPYAYFIRYESLLADFTSTCDYLGTLIGTPPRTYSEPERVLESEHWRPEHRKRYL